MGRRRRLLIQLAGCRWCEPRDKFPPRVSIPFASLLPPTNPFTSPSLAARSRSPLARASKTAAGYDFASSDRATTTSSRLFVDLRPSDAFTGSERSVGRVRRIHSLLVRASASLENFSFAASNLIKLPLLTFGTRTSGFLPCVALTTLPLSTNQYPKISSRREQRKRGFYSPFHPALA